MESFRVPVATYRVQFSLGFRFSDARNLVPYLHDLGITDLYASPRFKARKGSSHGYDVADPERVNSELGTEEEFDELVQRLRHYDMGLVLDIVPNHMAASPENPWWMDVLENGESSDYASFFDIDWHPATTKAAFLQENKILLPVLGDLYGRVLENQELSLKLDERGFFVRYYDARLPLDPKSYRLLLRDSLDRMRTGPECPPESFDKLAAVSEAVEQLPDRSARDAREIAARHSAKEEIKQNLWRLYQDDRTVRTFLDETLMTFNGSRGDARSFDRLDQLLSEQAYRLAYWKIAAEEINYRRFFDISDLVGLRLEDPVVFEARHAQIVQLVREGKVTGLRVDHIDGLYDPLDYLRRLQASLNFSGAETPGHPGFYVVVEKVLGGDEPLPEDWPVCGTTGYDFLNAVNGVFIEPQGLQMLEANYARFTGDAATFDDVCYSRNKLVMEQLFQGEVNALAHLLGRIAAQDRHARDLPFSELAQALVEVTACLPVYRTYIRDFEVSPRDRLYIDRALRAARTRTPHERVSAAAFDFLRCVLMLDPPYYADVHKKEWLGFVMRWQQFAGPVMAKGLEDTAYYVHNSLISLNEVGGDPIRKNLPTDLEAFHLFNQERPARWPCTLNATSTHDTKRSEDARTRINVLSELPDQWENGLRRWSRWNHSKKSLVNGRPVPDPAEEVLLYQTLLGAWPLDESELPGFKERLQAFALKATREAKVHTSWMNPQAEYEGAISSFLEFILDASGTNRFLRDFLTFQETIGWFGWLNALSMLLLKIASPGVPDFYQGMETWNLSLVDPDNRRPVDFERLARELDELRRREHEGAQPLLRGLLEHWRDGRVKFYTTWKALQFRVTHPQCFLEGDYTPLYASGKRIENLCAFIRHKDGDWALVAVPRLLTKIVDPGSLPLGQETWGASSLPLPPGAPQSWTNVLTGERLHAGVENKKPVIRLQHLFRDFPVALLSGDSDT
jgi:(1->4)-alpha-D-glucan 1-alpha-D-glucosylmutase